ncbi:MAG: aminotransferase class I/II-fold pyridoxal phosphate-dependent enzyme [Deltaproteobacteria bacterium]|nr:aminotransferase class I/II-fold pyridoxal phosphate-dependent enzyme [Deltaproteobacteria bacterium]
MSNILAKDIAIVGIGCRFPDAHDAEEFWDNSLKGRASFRPIPRERWHHEVFYSKSARDVDKTMTGHGAFIDDIDRFAALHYGISPRRLEVMDPQYRLLIEATRVAVQDAGYEVAGLPRSTTGVYAGISVSEYKNLMLARVTAMQLVSGAFGPAAGSQALRDAVVAMSDHLVPIRAFSIPGVLTNMSAATISQTFDLNGPSFAIDAACASASVAVWTAVQQLRAGLVDVALAGGAYLNLTPDNLIAFTRVGAISPHGVCRPFDVNASGFVQGDGVGMLYLKRMTDAVRDGDRVYAVIKGVGCNNDGRGEGPMTPRLSGQLEVLEMAYADAGFSPATVGYFEAHGTATRVGDPVEIEGLGRTLSKAGVDRSNAPKVGSVKGNIGHAMSAAGIAGLVRSIKALEHGIAPPQAGYTSPHPDLKLESWPMTITSEASPLEARGAPRRVGVSSFGFGGTNAHIVLEEAPKAKVEQVPELSSACAPESVIVSAPTISLLRGHLRELAEAIEARDAAASLADVAYTLSAKRSLERYRAVLTVATKADLLKVLRATAEALPNEPELPMKLGVGVTVLDHGERPEAQPKVAFLFPGQGAQRTGLLEHLTRRFPSFRAELTRLAGSADSLLSRPLLSYLYPELRDEAAEKALTATEVCQPAMAALGLSLDSMLRSLGAKPEVTIGHSLGEFAALASAGVIDKGDAVRLVALRGKAMSELSLEDPGTMAAVSGERGAVLEAIRGIEGVYVANVNHPRQVTISGTTPAVKRACEILVSRGFEARPLEVSHAFHTPVLAQISAKMSELVGGLAIESPKNTVISGVRPEPYDGDVAKTRATMISHATATVDFVRALEAARSAGVTVFVQLGAGSVLTGFAKATLPADEIFPITLSPIDDDGGRAFVEGATLLRALGAPIDLSRLFQGRSVVSLPDTPLERGRYWAVQNETQILPKVDHAFPSEKDRFGLIGFEAPKAEVAAASERDGLVALFQKQAEILRRHAEILTAQTRILSGEKVEIPKFEDVTSTEETSRLDLRADAAITPREERPSVPPPRWGEERPLGPTVRVPPADEAPKIEASKVLETVLEVVAKVSAFPKATLRAEQRLVEELGFDSIMMADLGRQVEGRFPELGGLPTNVFHVRTTVSELSSAVFDKLTKKTPAADQAALAPVKTYAVAVTPRRRADLPSSEARGTTWLVTEGDPILSQAVASTLVARGARVLRVAFSPNAQVPDRLTLDAVNSWPSAMVSDLVETLDRAGIKLKGLIHLDGQRVSLADAVLYDPIPVTFGLIGLDVERTLIVTALGGRLGLVRSKALDVHVFQAALLGFTKALSRERPDRIIRAVDVDPSVDAAVTAREVVAEALAADRDPEVGLVGTERFVPSYVETSFEEERFVGPDDVVLITGGAGDLGRAIAHRLLAEAPKAIVLVGRRAEDQAIRALVSELSGQGPRVRYVAADMTRTKEWKKVAAELEAELGAVTMAIHAAGLVEDAAVEKKTLDSINRVMSPKIDGYTSILSAHAKLKALVVFSSWAGRFGNAGQVDYAAANELLDHMAVLGAGRVRVLSIDWPPWSASKMVSGIPAILRGAMASEGVTFLDEAEGVDAFMRLLPRASGVVVVARGLPVPTDRAAHREIVSLTTHPYLDDHRLIGRPILPLASALDMMAEVGKKALMLDARAPFTIEELELVKGVDATEPVEVEVRFEGREGSGRAELLVRESGTFRPAYRAKISANVDLPAPPTLAGSSKPLPFDVPTFYAQHTFHGPSLRAIDRVDIITERGARGRLVTSKPTELGINRDAWALDPLVVDGAFQLAAYWAAAQIKKAGYPVGVHKVTVVRPFEQSGTVDAEVVLEKVEGDTFVGHIKLYDINGLYAVIEGVEGRFDDRLLGARPAGSTVRPEPLPETAPPSGRPAPGLSKPGLPKSELKIASLEAGPKKNGENGEHPVEVPIESYDVTQFDEVIALDQRLEMARLIGLENPYFNPHFGTAKNRSNVNGVEMINYSSYNYLGFSGHPEVNEASKAAVEKYGTSVSASRVASGERPLHRELEAGIASHLGVEDAIVYVSGHATNVSTIGCVVGKDDLVIHDQLAHDSILQGIKLSGATRRPYPHENMDALEEMLKRIRTNFRRVLITAEGIYSMDGDVTNLPRLIEIKKRYKSLLLIDEAHSIGVLGPSGRGVGHHFPGLDPTDVDMWMGTMSKSFSSCGGYIAGKKALVQFLKYSSPGFVYSVGMPASNAAAALKSLELMHRHPEIVEMLRSRSKFFLEMAKARGLNTGLAMGYAVVPVIVGNSLLCMKLSAALAKRKINVQPIVYPAVEDSSARLRFFLSATHTEDEIRLTVDAVGEELEKLRREEGTATASL